jgi:hypothetical protein
LLAERADPAAAWPAPGLQAAAAGEL